MQVHRPICRRMQVAKSRGCAEPAQPASQPLQRKSELRNISVHPRKGFCLTSFDLPSRYATSLADHLSPSPLSPSYRRSRLIPLSFKITFREQSHFVTVFHLVLRFSSGTPSIYHRKRIASHLPGPPKSTIDHIAHQAPCPCNYFPHRRKPLRHEQRPTSSSTPRSSPG